MSILHDKIEWQRGHSGEMEVAAWLRQRGWYIVPSYDYSGLQDDKAPKMHGAKDALVLPDLDICRDGKRIWCEVKTKASASFTRRTGQYEHGISHRLWRHYLEVERHSGCTVFLLVLEEDTSELLGRSLEALGEPRIYSGAKMGFSGMAFWPRSNFKFLAQLVREAAA